jgi:hypothetical protein
MLSLFCCKKNGRVQALESKKDLGMEKDRINNEMDVANVLSSIKRLKVAVNDLNKNYAQIRKEQYFGNRQALDMFKSESIINGGQILPSPK